MTKRRGRVSAAVMLLVALAWTTSSAWGQGATRKKGDAKGTPASSAKPPAPAASDAAPPPPPVVAPAPAVVGAGAAPLPVKVLVDTNVEATIPVLAWLGDQVDLAPNVGNDKDVWLFKADKGLAWRTNACKFKADANGLVPLRRGTVPEATATCAAIWKDLWAEGGSYVLGAENKFFAVKVEAAKAQTVTLEDGKPGYADWVKDGSALHYFDEGGKLQHEQVKKPINDSVSALFALLPTDGSKSRRLYHEHGGGVVAVDYSVKPKKPSSPKPPPPLGEAMLRKLCAEWAAHHSKNPSKLYVVCQDATNEALPVTVVLPVNFDDPLAENGHLWTNTSMAVYTYVVEGRAVEIKLSGTVGIASPVYVQTKDSVAGAKALEGVAPSSDGPQTPDGLVVVYRPFGPRTPGTSPVLETTVKKPKADGGYEDAGKFAHEWYIEREYRVAVRAGLAALYGPWDEKYEIRSTTGNSAGREIALTQDGVPTADLTVGLSVFAGRVGETGMSPMFSWYFGLGFLTGSAKGADVFTSLMTGPELSFGKDFSIAGVAGLRRTMTLEDGYKEHSPVDSDDLDKVTTFSATPVFGVMLNLSPYVWTVGR